MKSESLCDEKQAMYLRRAIEIEDVNCPGCGESFYVIVTKTFDYDYFTTDIPFAVVRCQSCDLLYLNPRPRLSEISKIYPKEYSAYHFSNIRNPIIRKARNYMQSQKAHRILKLIPKFSESPSILDVGCGSPALLSLIRNASSKPIDLYGNDFNPDIIRDIRKAGFKAIEGNFENVNWQEGFFDVIVMNQVIEHLFDVTGVLRKTHKLLKDKGTLFIETPSDEGMDASLFRHHHWGGYHVPRHLLIFNLKTIQKTLQRFGFLIDKVEYNPSPNFWTSSFRNLLIQKGLPRSITKRMNYKNITCMMFFTVIDVLTKSFHPTSNMRIIARKQAS
ncbi:MAG: class I SAM-dependent methyltransferase [Deltaproteobacteria bacterium]|nr:class I SAM-dependent methyltransferase [Deltaproteobacteria bacterium]